MLQHLQRSLLRARRRRPLAQLPPLSAFCSRRSNARSGSALRRFDRPQRQCAACASAARGGRAVRRARRAARALAARLDPARGTRASARAARAALLPRPRSRPRYTTCRRPRALSAHAAL